MATLIKCSNCSAPLPLHGDGFATSGDAQAMERLGKAWMKAVAELRAVKQTDINLPFLTATKNGPMHYQRDIDEKTMSSLYAVAKKLG